MYQTISMTKREIDARQPATAHLSVPWKSTLLLGPSSEIKIETMLAPPSNQPDQEQCKSLPTTPLKARTLRKTKNNFSLYDGVYWKEQETYCLGQHSGPLGLNQMSSCLWVGLRLFHCEVGINGLNNL